MKSNNILGIRLEECRKKAGLTQQQLAADLHVQRQIVSYYENGSRKPDIEMLKLLACRFGVTTDYLLGITDAQSADGNMRFVCDYTGMSETVIEYLHVCSDFGLPVIHFLNELIGENAVVQKAMMENGDNIESMDWPDLKNDTLLTTLVDYMEADFQQNSGERFYISANGNVVDPHSCDSQNTLTHWKDMISVTSISAGEIAEQILKSRITNAVVGFKQKYQPD